MADGGGVELLVLVAVRSGELAADDRELWGSVTGMESDWGEPDL